MKSSEVVGAVLFASVASVMIYAAKRSKAMLPTAAEQAWLDSQLATPPGQKLTPEEQKWLDKQVQDVQDAEMLDDARQAGERCPALALLLPCFPPRTSGYGHTVSTRAPRAAPRSLFPSLTQMSLPACRVRAHGDGTACAAYAPGEGSSPNPKKRSK